MVVRQRSVEPIYTNPAPGLVRPCAFQRTPLRIDLTPLSSRRVGECSPAVTLLESRCARACIQAMTLLLRGRAFDVVAENSCSLFFLIDLRRQAVSGDHAAHALSGVGIAVGQVVVADCPFRQSGIAIDTSAIGARRFDDAGARQLARAICDVLEAIDSVAVALRVRRQIRALSERFTPIRPSTACEPRNDS